MSKALDEAAAEAISDCCYDMPQAQQIARRALAAALPEAPPLTLIDAMAAAICETDDDDAWVLAHATYRALRAHLLGGGP